LPGIEGFKPFSAAAKNKPAFLSGMLIQTVFPGGEDLPPSMADF
jgi:hypothetical protein